MSLNSIASLRVLRHLCLLSLIAATALLSACGGAPPRQAAPPRDPEPVEVARAAPPEVPFIEPMVMPPRPDLPPPIYGDNTLRVALLLPLSGPRAALGETMLQAAQLALFDIGDNRIVLMPRDTGGTPQGGASAAQQAIDDGAQIILGPVFADVIRSAGSVAVQYRVPVVGFSTDRSVAGNGVYIMGFTPEEQVDRIVAYAISNGKRRFAAMIPEGAYGRTVLEALRKSVARRGGTMIQTETYQEDEQALYAPVRRLARYDNRRQALEAEREALAAFGEDDDFAQELLGNLSSADTYGRLDYDAVLLPAGGPMLRALAPLLAYYDIDPNRVKFLGTGLWDDPGLVREPSLKGGWYAGPNPDAAKLFSQHFASAYADRPPRVASLAYDSVALVAGLIRKYPRSPFTERALRDDSGFAGLDGIFRFGPSGVVERGLAVIEVTPEGMVPVDPAPSAFGSRLARP